jgi:LemA protein
MKKWLVPIGIVVVLAFMLMSGYNGLVQINEDVNGKWSQVENQLQRRADLIPNLVETVKAYAAQEVEVFTALANARAALAGAGTVGETEAANQEMTSALGRLIAIAEAYPELKSNTNFLALQDELAGTENRIATARMDYNTSVQAFNTRVKSLPTALYAGMLGFETREYFEAEDGAEDGVDVDF